MQHSLFGTIPAYHRHPPVSMQMTLYPRDRGQVCPPCTADAGNPDLRQNSSHVGAGGGAQSWTQWRRHNTASSLNIAHPDGHEGRAMIIHYMDTIFGKLASWVTYSHHMVKSGKGWCLLHSVAYTQQNVKMLVLDSTISSYDDLLFTLILFSVLVYYFIGWLWYFPDCSVIVQESKELLIAVIKRGALGCD